MNSKTTLSILIVQLIFVLAVTTDHVPLKVVFEEIHFQGNPKIVTATHHIKNLSGETAVDLTSNLMEDLPETTTISVDILKEKSAGAFDGLIHSGELHLCETFKNATEQPLFKLILGGISKFTNIPLQCPVLKGEYWMKDFVIDSKMIPSIIPEGRFKLEMKLNKGDADKNEIYNSQWVFSIMKR